MRYNILFIVILTISIVSCKKDSEKKPLVKPITEEISLLDTLSLRLNSGEKWIVNNETHVGVSKMDSIIKAHKTNKENNYINLGNNLSMQASFIIKSCNMTGEAHNQLHVILIPMLDEIYVLKDSQNTEEQRKAAQKLEGLIVTYFKYFKI
mgnify:CR=1 FL=1